MLLPRWDLWPYLVARSNCTNQDPISTQKAAPCLKSRSANMDPPHGKSYEDGFEMTNDDCSRIGCGLGQSGVDDGAGLRRMGGHGEEKPE